MVWQNSYVIQWNSIEVLGKESKTVERIRDNFVEWGQMFVKI